MPTFRTGTVGRLLSERPGLQRVETDQGRAYVLTELTGSVAAGDRVVLNTTAVDLGLGTGGWHVVHWNLERDSYDERGPGHIMKLRYTSLQVDPLSLDRECDWVIKYKMIEAYRERHGLTLTSPKVALLDLQYHDVNRERGLFYKMQNRGLVERMCDDADIDEAVDVPPQTTRARLRGEFIRRAKERKRDYTVDWVHLKLNDQAQRTVLCKDPFKAKDERVERLIASL